VLLAIRKFLGRENGQDLAEYCLLTALVLLIGLGIFYHVHGGMADLWTTADSTLGSGNTTVGTGTQGTGTHGQH
jgi:Flp pilus assembly pilin Flp